MPERVFDWKPRFDERSKLYPIRALVGDDQPVKYRLWAKGPILDQGYEGACVGFGWSAELAGNPKPVRGVSNDTARSLYRRAQQIDEWEGENYEGTSVLAGAKATAETGFLTEYRWAFGLDDVLRALSWQGPVVLGVNWYSGMYDTDSKGFIHPTGDLLGGHCLLARGVSTYYNRVFLQNSWGKEWGRNGGCYITFDDLGQLLSEYGEACVPVGRVSGRIT
jgi:hypothetical protein